jgi:hypothetical protein
MQINWPIIAVIITAITTISAPVLQVVFADWYASRKTQPNPNPETKRTADRTRTRRFLSAWGSPIVLFGVNLWGLIVDFRTLHPPLVVRDVFFVAVNVAGLAMSLLIVAVMLILNLMSRMLDIQGRMADSHSGALDTISWLMTEIGKKADSRRRSK